MIRLEEISKQAVEELLYATFTEGQIYHFRRFLNSSAHVWALFVDDKLVCVWGLVAPSLLSDWAYLWLHTTPEIEGHQFVFIRQSQIAIRKMLSMYSTLYGHNTGADEQSVRWLKWLGAEFAEPVNGFLPFEIRGR